MAFRAQPINLAGVVATIVVVALVLLPLAAVIWRGQGLSQLSQADWAALRFTLVQALLSMLISIMLAIPIARALARRQFLGRSWIVALMGAPFILPSLVAVLGLIAVFGRNGWVSQILMSFGFDRLSIYGLVGVIMGHVFFNLPLAVRLIYQGWRNIPAERFQLAANLRFGPKEIRRYLEYPMLANILPGTAAVIFLVCLTSFAVALTLGGGPNATTIELAIYQAFRLEFDLAHAASLAVIQVCLCALIAGAVWAIGRPPGLGVEHISARVYWPKTSLGLCIFDSFAIGLASAFLLLPIFALVIDGLPAIASLGSVIWLAALRSIGVALISGVLCLGLAAPMAIMIARARPAVARMVEGMGSLALSISPLVLGTGLFVLIYPITNPLNWALTVTAIVNAAMALPFVLRALVPAAVEAERDLGPLADHLGLLGLRRWRWLYGPRLRPALGFSAGLSCALSVGDLGVIALFADPEQATLPLQVYRLLATYRVDQAAAASLILLLLCLGSFLLFDYWGRRNVGV